MSDHKYILSLSGGGVRVLFAAHILDAMVEHCGRPLTEMFDLMVGSSGGGILCLYSAQNNQNNLTDLFNQKNLTKWCDKSCWDKVMKEIQFEPVYNGKGKTSSLRRYFHDQRMGEVKSHVAIPVMNISTNRPEIITTYDDVYNEYRIREVADAATAAIPYFPAIRLNDHNYIDGGVAANDPILIAYTEARRLWGDHVSLRILTIGTGIQPMDEDWKSKDVRGWGTIQWVANGMVDLFMDSPNKLMLNQIEKLLLAESEENRFLRLDRDIPHIKLDDTNVETCRLLEQVAQETFHSKTNEIDAFFSM